MKGDFGRVSFRRGGRYSVVIMQQGRVQLDADWNEDTLCVRLRGGKISSIGPLTGGRTDPDNKTMRLEFVLFQRNKKRAKAQPDDR